MPFVGAKRKNPSKKKNKKKSKGIKVMANKNVNKNVEVQKMEKVEKTQKVEKEAAKTVVQSTKITVDNAIVVNVTSPSSIDRVAKEKQINPQEVFVRCTFQVGDGQFTASNKLKFLTKTGYLELLQAKENKTPMKFVVDIEKEFFYIEHDVSIDSLFDTPVEVQDTRKKLTELINM